jgi:hypothetical protein
MENSEFYPNCLQTSSLNSRNLKRRRDVLAESDLDKVIVDVGNPVLGILLGMLVIAGTMGSYYLWDYYQNGADVSPSIVTSENGQPTAFPKVALTQRP